MGHDHAAHSHGPAGPGDARRLSLALAAICAFMLVEVLAGILAHSLALLSDAGHMLTDAGALGFSLLALRLARRPAAGALTFGLRRAEALSAQANGLTLMILAAIIAYEAVRRLVSPPHVHAPLVLIVALAGAAVNGAVVWVLARADRTSMSVEGSFQHILTDLYGFAGTALAAIVIIATGFDRADAIASLGVALLMSRSGLALVKASGRVFLEAAPPGLDPEQVGNALAGQPGVIEVHDLHVWEVASGFPAMSAHVLVSESADCHDTRRRMEQMLHSRFGLHHTTLQVDHDRAGLLQIASIDQQTWS